MILSQPWCDAAANIKKSEGFFGHPGSLAGKASKTAERQK